VGYLRDIRRLTVALSRARLGLYILGRRQVFESCFELRQAFELLLKRPDKLHLVTGELWPSERTLADEVDKEVPGEAVMESVEHIGQYVYEMTNTRVQQLRTERGLLEDAPVPSAAGATAIEQAQQDDAAGTEEVEEEAEASDEEEEGTARVEGFEAEED